ncbi:hypothetical protein EDC01DRAFT_635517 [Geopyxis carbonaria]|nr:hypothetical protein EDC01DRAFT_635517 [Geopyxis carbonaria]
MTQGQGQYPSAGGPSHSQTTGNGAQGVGYGNMSGQSYQHAPQQFSMGQGMQNVDVLGLQSEVQRAPARNPEEHGGVKSLNIVMPDGWQDEDLNVLIDLFCTVMPDKRRPFENPDLILRIRNSLKRSLAVTQAVAEDGVSSTNRLLLSEVQAKARLYMFRFFTLADHVDDLIDERFGVDFRTAEVRQYRAIRTSILGYTYTWKSRALKDFLAHVESYMEEHGWLKEANNVTLIQEFFQKRFQVMNMGGLFHFAGEKYVRWNMLPPLAEVFIHDCYFNLCTEMVLHLQGKLDWEKIIDFWDLLGDSTSAVTPLDFPSPNVKRSAKATRFKATKKNKTTLSAHARYQTTACSSAETTGSRSSSTGPGNVNGPINVNSSGSTNSPGLSTDAGILNGPGIVNSLGGLHGPRNAPGIVNSTTNGFVNRVSVGSDGSASSTPTTASVGPSSSSYRSDSQLQPRSQILALAQSPPQYGANNLEDPLFSL